ncbi:MAG TPA: hypothetical protein VHU77_07015 [Candidatus Limnocylindria bacterium]|nr:hypothetical protein [Candidatus Limnocylindria bacterium]
MSSDSARETDAQPAPAQLDAALHGFALILTIGDRSQSASVAARAFADAAPADPEVDPSRVTTWLRARVLRDVRRLPRDARLTSDDRFAALHELGVERSTTEALAGLSLDERAALIAASVERHELSAVATIIGKSPGEARRILRAARAGYRDAALAAQAKPRITSPPTTGIALRVDRVARAVRQRRAAGAGS